MQQIPVDYLNCILVKLNLIFLDLDLVKNRRCGKGIRVYHSDIVYVDERCNGL